MSKSLKVVLVYDVGVFGGFVLYVWTSSMHLGFVGSMLPLGFMLLLVAGNKAVKKDATALTRKEKIIRFGVGLGGAFLLSLWLFIWALGKKVGLAWGMAAAGWVLIAAICGASWYQLNASLKRMPPDDVDSAAA